MPSTASIVSSAVAVSALSYLVYFDYQRRNSPEFRRKLRREAQKYEKAKEHAATESKKAQRSQIEQLIEDSLAAEPLPTSLQEREQFFIAEIARADELLNSGEAAHVDAALAFYRALIVYPNPADLIGVYEKSVKPQSVLDLVRTMVIIRPPKEIARMVNETIATPDMSVE